MSILDTVLSVVPSRNTLLAIVAVVVVGLLGWWAYKQMFGSSEETFQTMTDSETVLRMFYVDWCPHCQDAKPEFEKLTKLTEINGKPIKIEMVNGEENAELAKQFNVTGYPTIILSHAGKNNVYEGERTESALVDFLQKNVV
jgi:thiol-disulfide isomerase/thioredoxin